MPRVYYRHLQKKEMKKKPLTVGAECKEQYLPVI